MAARLSAKRRGPGTGEKNPLSPGLRKWASHVSAAPTHVRGLRLAPGYHLPERGCVGVPHFSAAFVLVVTHSPRSSPGGESGVCVCVCVCVCLFCGALPLRRANVLTQPRQPAFPTASWLFLMRVMRPGSPEVQTLAIRTKPGTHPSSTSRMFLVG
ncbi:hypothetical protein LZ30DRAFT_714729 [Colletotrichum cereale]|nr:hypothetical protein LZ30DRAFT_714729 [Colletotrichum cereale]